MAYIVCFREPGSGATAAVDRSAQPSEYSKTIQTSDCIVATSTTGSVARSCYAKTCTPCRQGQRYGYHRIHPDHPERLLKTNFPVVYPFLVQERHSIVYSATSPAYHARICLVLCLVEGYITAECLSWGF